MQNETNQGHKIRFLVLRWVEKWRSLLLTKFSYAGGALVHPLPSPILTTILSVNCYLLVSVLNLVLSLWSVFEWHLEIKETSLFSWYLLGFLVSGLQATMVIVDLRMVPTVPHAEYWEVTEWYPCGEKANGRGGLEKFIAAGGLVFRSQDMMASVVQITAHLALSAMMSFWSVTEVCRLL